MELLIGHFRFTKIRSPFADLLINTKQYDLVCGGSWKVELISTVYMAGRLIGALTCGMLSDR